MWRTLVLAMTLAGCVQLPPHPQDAQAKQFQSVPDKAVIYVVRNDPDINWQPAPLVLDGGGGVTTYPGTFIRWEVAPGPHRITGLSGDGGLITLNTAAGKVYFVRQTVLGFGSPSSNLQTVSESDGRAVAMRGQVIPVR
jgi:hypothetical protein